MTDKAPPMPTEQQEDTAAAEFPVVGVGASAGGLAAFEAFFSGMPADEPTGMAYVLVQHLAPDHESRLVDLIQRQTTMDVREAEDGMKVEPDHVYVIPPACSMAIRQGRLRLVEPREPRGHRLPVDFFFRSLAEEQGDKAICVVLSGTGSDGTLGVREVKGHGGLVLAQDPDTIEYGGMPRSAIATGKVDHVLTPEEMPARMLRYAGHDSIARSPDSGTTSAGDEDALHRIFDVVRTRSGHDFTHYKQNSIRRRIERRMAVQQVDSLEEYARYLEEASDESEALFRDFLIGVTRFFRDPEAFTALAEKGVPPILEREKGSAIRVWVPGCSTGEEAYSIAILLREQMAAARMHNKLQVFATDIDGRAIETARAGTYPASIAEDVSPERLDRYFTRTKGGDAYRIRKEIRDALVFSEQDLIADPPFFKLDLISCRNVLIYMGPQLQKKLMSLFHFALVPGGILFLGSSETVGDHGDLFATLDRTSKVYRRKPDRPGSRRGAAGSLSMPSRSRASTSSAKPSPAQPGQDGAEPTLRELVESELLEHHAPVAALVDIRGEILYLHGRTGRFLEPAQGDVGMNILSMAREGLRRELAIALHQAAAADEPVHRGDLRVLTNGHRVRVRLTVRAISSSPSDAPPEHEAPADLYLVVLDTDRPEAVPAPTGRRAETEVETEAEEVEQAEDGSAGADDGDDPRIALLEEELSAKEEYLQAVQEEMQAANEELRASIEELQSTNEELQSTNEELETSKEELQSVNEELATINTELETKVTDLSRVENDMNNLLAGTGIGTVFVDHALRIQRFTPAATELLNLIDTDVGRPVGHLTSRLSDYDHLSGDIEEVLETLVPREVEVRTEAGSWYLLRIRPYRTLENVIEGAVITFTEITELKEVRVDLEAAEAERRLAVVVKDANDAVTIQNLDGSIRAWNPAATRIYGWTEDEAIGMSSLELAPEDAREENEEMLARLAAGEAPEPFRTRRTTRDRGVIPVWVTATALVDESGDVYAFSTTEREAAPAATLETP